MAAPTATDNSTDARKNLPGRQWHWQTILFYAVTLLLLIVGLWLRLNELGLPFDRDSYDEGVYWQSLRAMSAGHTLYQQIFYSQPPFFLLSIFPVYTLFGQTIWSARLGIALVSLLGLLGAFLLGNVVSGRIGALVALLLLVTDPGYLIQSQTLQAEAPSAALALLAVALAYLWWKHPQGRTGLWYAVLCAMSLALGILCKLLDLAAVVPVGMLMLAQLWRIFQQPAATRLNNARSLLVGVAAFFLTLVLVLLPFAGAGTQMWQGVITFHTDAATLLKGSQATNISQIRAALSSITALAALYGTCVALLRRDWLVVPLIGWLIATVLLLWQQTPLFNHHLIMLVPPLIGLAVLGIKPIKLQVRLPRLALGNILTIVALIILLAVSTIHAASIRRYYVGAEQQSAGANITKDLQVARSLQQAIQPGQLVITDAQFVAGLADRSTPASLADTSGVRINTGYVTSPQLIHEASQPQVHAVLFYSGRLKNHNLRDFLNWLPQHFRLVQRYGNGQELWVKL